MPNIYYIINILIYIIFAINIACVQGRVYAPPDEPDVDSEAIRDFNEVVVRDARVETVTMPVRDGISIVRLRSETKAAQAAPASAGADGMPLGAMGSPDRPMGRVIGVNATNSSRKNARMPPKVAFQANRRNGLGKLCRGTVSLGQHLVRAQIVGRPPWSGKLL